MANANITSGRWWEYYAVRYFVGTVIGAGAILLFNEYSASPLRDSLSTLIASSSPKHVIALIALGLAYSYVASAPILVFHALRYRLVVCPEKKFSAATWWFIVFFIAALPFDSWMFPLRGWQFWEWILVWIIFSIQMLMLIATFIDKNLGLAKFYAKLAKRRALGTPQIREYVESYRHLREHGNAFAIIFLEIVFGLALISTRTLNMLCVLLVLWITPAMMVWGVGTGLEAWLLKDVD